MIVCLYTKTYNKVTIYVIELILTIKCKKLNANLHDLQQPFFFSRGATFTLTRISFKLFALLNPIIGTFSKTFPCSLSGVNNKCISESTFLDFKNTG